MTDHAYSFYEEKHEYRIDGRVVPSVTQVMSEVLGPPWQATEWHLQRGRAVHACCALIAQGKEFENDPQIDGQCEACRTFLETTGEFIEEVEEELYSVQYQFAGTPDLTVREGKHLLILDYKATLTKSVEIQLGGYGILKPEAKCGLGVQLNDDGTYKLTKLYDLKRPRQKFLGLLSAYNTKKELGMIKKKKETE